MRRGTIVTLLLVAHTALLGWGAFLHSPTFDETGHLPAGISHWKLQRFELYRVNPPLVRMVAALPVILAGAEAEWQSFDPTPGHRSEFTVGREFIELNGARSFWYFTLARWACIPFSLLGAWVCYRWAGQLYGSAAGLLSLAVWCFSPTVLGNGQTIQPDLAAAALSVAALYSLWCWCRQPKWIGAACSGVVLGLGLLTKTTLIVLLPLVPVLWAVQRWPRRGTVGRLRIEAAQVGAVILLALYTLNLGYLFDGSFRRLGDYTFFSKTLSGRTEGDRGSYTRAGSGGNRFADTWLAAVPVPLPQSFVLGIDAQKRDFEGGLRSYLRGEMRHRGWWYFYLYGLGVKVPVGTWLLLAAAAGAACWRVAGVQARWPDVIYVALPMVVILAVVSSQTGMNNHVRYVLPVLPFAFIFAGAAAAWLHAGRWPATVLVGAALAWSIGSSLWVYPHSHSYFNELAGGPVGGHDHLLSSNIDYGEDLLFLKWWWEEHDDGRPLHLAYFGNFDPRIAGLEFRLPPRPPTRAAVKKYGVEAVGPAPGWHAISVNYLHGTSVPLHDGKGGLAHRIDYSYFREFEPVAMAGYGIYIYDISVEEANRARIQLELPPLRNAAAQPDDGG